MGKLEAGGPRFAQRALHLRAVFLDRRGHARAGVGAVELGRLEHRVPLLLQLAFGAGRGLLHRAQQRVFVAFEFVERLLHLRFLEALAIAGQALERHAVGFHRLEQRVIHAAHRVGQRLRRIDRRLEGADVHAFGHRAQHVPDLRERELPPVQRLERQVADGRADVFALAHAFARHLAQQLIRIQWQVQHVRFPFWLRRRKAWAPVAAIDSICRAGIRGAPRRSRAFFLDRRCC